MSALAQKNPQLSATALDPAALIADTTDSAIRTFFYQLAECNRAYRSLHSLTQQIEHQYHGRFLVELIQNAHDALLPRRSDSESLSRIEIRLCDEGEFGTLYVANDGEPFSHSNFNSLSQLGQSDKDPQKSIGNKGIGFRSVLEITDSPSIYSRATRSSSHFDGFCFGFSPVIVQRIGACAVTLMDGDNGVRSPVSNIAFIDWADGQLMKFRASNTRCAMQEGMSASDWLTREMQYVSPYLLPYPLRSDGLDPHVTDFEQHGFATLIRFPLKDARTAALVREKLNGLDEGTLLFLDKVSCLVLDSGEHRRELVREEVERTGSQLNGREVRISLNGEAKRRYWIWSRNLVLADAPEDVRKTVQHLPGKWPQMHEATVSVGVRLRETPEKGTLSIFLPTLLETGCAAHINAPFFGDMSRTHVDFGASQEPSTGGGAMYNRYLLSQSAELALNAIQHELVEHGTEEARAIVDLLAPFGTGEEARERWTEFTKAAAQRLGLDIDTAPWFRSDQGWSALNTTSLLPSLPNASAFTPDILRRHATFSVFVQELDSRSALIETLSGHFDTGARPLPDHLAETVEAIALAFHAHGDADWNAFWRDTDKLFDGDCSVLAGKLVLLGSDGKLHAGGTNTSTVFFIPRQGLSDDEEVENDGDVKEIPATLSHFVAFLNEGIQVYEEKGGRLTQTRIRRLLLESKLVSRFRREDIVSDVLVRRTPTLPASLDGPHAQLCRDILLWGLRLMAHLADRTKNERALRLLRGLPAPCNGGWYPLGDTAFGPGWPGTLGEVTYRYLKKVKTVATRGALQRLLLPPTHAGWNGDGNSQLALLLLLGVFDGLRLNAVQTKSWRSSFTAAKHDFRLPHDPAPGWSVIDWKAYGESVRHEARPQYNHGTYEFQVVHVFPGLDKYAEFDDDARKAFMDVVLGSAGHWEDGWQQLKILRVGGNWDCILLPSPLFWRLARTDWLGVTEDASTTWCRPAERWYVPALELGRGRKWQFAHLRPLPGELADRLDREPRLAAVLRRLGMPKFEPDNKSPSTLLLDALAAAVMRNDIPNRDVFLGQVRAAWRGFEPEEGKPFPKLLLVQRGAGALMAETPAESSRAYLPDSTKSFHGALKHFELPVVAIESDDAKRLAERFEAAYPNAIVRASRLEPVPLVDGSPWSDSPQERLCNEPCLEWIVPVLLTIAAFHGPQSHGTTSTAFRESLEAFREARIVFFGKVETSLTQDGIPVAPSMAVPALWLAQPRVLLANVTCKDDIAALSEALASVLKREDLEVPINLVLSTAGSEPDTAAIVRGLERLKLTAEHYRDVREHWRGDAGKVIEMLVPLLTILQPSANIGALVELDTDEAIEAFLGSLGNPNLDSALIKMARESADMFDFGCQAFHRFGSHVQLSNWNTVLAGRGEPPLENSEAESAFRAHVSGCAQTLRSFVAHLARQSAGIGSFMVMWAQIESAPCPGHFSTQYWEVTCALTLSTITPLFATWHASSEELGTVQHATSADDLARRLAGLGVDVGFDPLLASRDNREILSGALQHLQQIGLAWALDSRQPNPADWEARADAYFDRLVSEAGDMIFLRSWDEQDVWRLLQTLAAGAEPATFWVTVAAASNPDDLICRLGLTNDSLGSARARLDDLRERAKQRRKVVEICGSAFDGSDDNLAGLWTHIRAHFPNVAIGDLPPVDLRKLEALTPMVRKPPAKERGKNSSRGRAAAPKYLSKSMENLIGLSGEIHAFRMLQRTYGAAAVSASSWVSANSTLVFPDNAFDEGKGCDFIIAHADRTYYIEVKSSEEKHAAFTMGSSEIRLAKELGGKSRKRRKETFLILRVTHALSAQPGIELLPNPYDAKYQPFFDIEDADARVAYRPKK